MEKEKLYMQEHFWGGVVDNKSSQEDIKRKLELERQKKE